MCVCACAGFGGSGLFNPEESTILCVMCVYYYSSLFVVCVCIIDVRVRVLVCALLSRVCVRFCVQVLAAVASVIQRNRQLEASLSQASQSNQHLQVRQCIVCGGGGGCLWVGGCG